MAKKKGFMTPERKKKLRTLLRKKAKEELLKEEERKSEERKKTIVERCGIKTDLVGKRDLSTEFGKNQKHSVTYPSLLLTVT